MDEATGEAFALKVYPGRADRRTRADLDKELPDGRFGVRMELCAQSLTELVATFGPLSVQDVLSLGEALATTLAAAHQAGVVHGGMTPGNVLFRRHSPVQERPGQTADELTLRVLSGPVPPIDRPGLGPLVASLPACDPAEGTAGPPW